VLRGRMQWPVEDLGPAQTLCAFKIRLKIIKNHFKNHLKLSFFCLPGPAGKSIFRFSMKNLSL
jgi:hypothetical protein